MVRCVCVCVYGLPDALAVTEGEAGGLFVVVVVKKLSSASDWSSCCMILSISDMTCLARDM